MYNFPKVRSTVLKNHQSNNMHFGVDPLGVSWVFRFFSNFHVFFDPQKGTQTKKKGSLLGTHVSTLGHRTSQSPLSPKRWPERGLFRVLEGAQTTTTSRRGPAPQTVPKSIMASCVTPTAAPWIVMPLKFMSKRMYASSLAWCVLSALQIDCSSPTCVTREDKFPR